jgi:hypothetical protein
MSVINKITFIGLISLSIVTGCAPFEAQPVLDYESRSITRNHGGVSVSISVLSDKESREIYGVPLADKDIQPVWIQVENADDAAYWLMSVALDPYFFPASEAVEAFSSDYTGNQLSEIKQRFESLAFHNPIPPGTTVSGFVLANRDEGVKMVQVDLVGDDRYKSFSVMAAVPGFRSDYQARKVFTQQIYSDEEIINYTSSSAFRAALESLPCCATNKDKTKDADPLNLVVVGGRNDAFPALVRRGWRPTEQTYTGSVMKMINSVLSGERYPYAPVSPLYLFGRPQDLALQKARDNIHQRNHLRLWLSPIRFHGKPVWVGQISRDIGTRLTIHSAYLTTHKIDPDVDEARTALLEDMAYSQSLVKLGLVKGVGKASRDKPRENLTTDPYYTDGFRTVLVFDEKPTAITDIEFFNWESREGGFIEQSVKRQQ